MTEEPAAVLRRVLEAFAAEGFPAEIIGQWTIPANDAADLIATVRERAPRRILEVGTFVGLSTILMALVSPADARIVSVDPNFPVSVEMSSMGSRLGAIDPAMPTQAVAAAVARRLGVAHKLELVEGGFSASASFASRRAQSALAVPVVGPGTCAAFGPFDLAFIDGLRYADVVHSDLALAVQHLKEEGVVLMHDCVGMWGTNVRAGIFQFLTHHPEWRLLHPPFRDLYRSIGTVFRPARAPELAAHLLPAPPLPPRFTAELPSLVNALLRRTGAGRLVELAHGAPLLAEPPDPAIPFAALDLSPLGGAPSRELAEALLGQTGSTPGETLFVAPLAMESLPDAAVAALFAALAGRGAMLGFLRTPPGEAGAATLHSRPLRRWARLAAQADGQLHEVPALDIATNRFLFVIRAPEDTRSASLCGVSLFAPLSKGAAHAAAGFAPLLAQRLDEAEQDELLAVHYGGGFASVFGQMAAAQALLGDARQAIKASQCHRAEAASLARDLAQARSDLDQARSLREQQRAALRERPGLRHLAGATLRLPRTLFARTLDNVPEVVVASALRHAVRRGVEDPCLMLSWQPEEALLRRLLADLRVGAVGAKDSEPTSLPPDLAANPRVGRYFHFGGWMLPNPRRVVYFLGPWRLVSQQMLAEAARAGVEALHFRVGSAWATVRPQSLYRFAGTVRQLRRLRAGAARGAAGLREVAARAGLLKPTARRSAAGEAAAFVALAAVPAAAGATPGRVVLVSGNLAPGGAERQVANTLIGLKRRGTVEPMLLAHYLDDGPTRHAFHLPRVQAAGVPAREIRRVISGPRDRRLPPALAKVAGALPGGLVVDIGNLVLEFEALRPEVVHAWLDWDNIRAGLAAVIAGVPRVILSGRNLNPSHYTLYQPYLDAAYRALATSPRVVFLNNRRAGADSYADWIGMPREAIAVVHNGLDFGGRQRLPASAIAERRAALG
ncbi:MAG: class I SAM-dependent methyltransferase, partial [Roseomonas sp.]|nr:class I SAM-dependent methyltransferase [Roseomonas sp.]